VPVTARLSRQFYERLGDDVANELVEWLNSVDISYRQELRELFEAHFGRFEARLQQQTAELRGEMGALRSELRGEIYSRYSELSREIGSRYSELSGEIGSQRAELRGEFSTRLAELKGELGGKIDAQAYRLIMWNFGFWVTNLGAVLGILKLVGAF
jgi:hypothetical protein